ncbi:hypothetical protein BC628DRAFT_1325394 [Trametes gibbosa]|nr:hypothetical protein BC628DRAFT_1325394 [Trametes gibbosa]
MVNLPPEVLSAVASYATPRELLVLSCTSKALQRAAEPRLYETMVLRDAQVIFLACHALLAREAYRAPYVKRMLIYQDPRRVTGRNNLTNTPDQFWLAIQHALTKTVNLENLLLQDPTVSHSWILDHDDIKFQLREASLRLPWDEHMVSFLQTQHKLTSLATDDAREDGPLYPLSPTALPILESYCGPILVVAELLGSPLRRLQMRTEDETAPLIPTIVSDLGKIMKTLHNLCILGLPEELTLETWHHLHRCLMQLPALALIELDVTHWEPRPNEHLQRAILLELRIFCPTLQQVVFWISQHRFHWFCRDGQWLFFHHANRYQVQDTFWRTSDGLVRKSSGDDHTSHITMSAQVRACPLHMSTVNTASTRLPAAQRHASPGAAAPTIASLPSLAHSLSIFPTMTVVTNDMVHYGMLCRTKGESEAKLNSALRKTKQRQDAGPGAMVSARDSLLSVVA